MRARRLFLLLAVLAASGLVGIAQSAGPSGVDEIDHQVAAIREALSTPAANDTTSQELAALTRIETSLAKQDWRNAAVALNRGGLSMGTPRWPLYSALASFIENQAEWAVLQSTEDLRREEEAAATLLSNPKITGELWNAWVADFQPLIARAKQAGPGPAWRAAPR